MSSDSDSHASDADEALDAYAYQPRQQERKHGGSAAAAQQRMAAGGGDGAADSQSHRPRPSSGSVASVEIVGESIRSAPKSPSKAIKAAVRAGAKLATKQTKQTTTAAAAAEDEGAAAAPAAKARAKPMGRPRKTPPPPAAAVAAHAAPAAAAAVSSVASSVSSSRASSASPARAQANGHSHSNGHGDGDADGPADGDHGSSGDAEDESGDGRKRKKAKYTEPILVDGEPTWTAQAIVGEDRDENRQIVYMVKWTGFSHAENTWEPPSSLESCDFILSCWAAEKRLIAEAMLAKRQAAVAASAAPSADPAAASAAAAVAAATAPSSAALAAVQFHYPIYDRALRSRLGKRSYKSDLEWSERAYAKAEAAAARKAEAANKAKEAERRKRAKAAQEANQARRKEDAVKESKAARRAREEAERAAAEAIREAHRRSRQAELESTEPYYYCTADDSILMASMDSEEEDEWGVVKEAPASGAARNGSGRAKKRQTNGGNKATVNGAEGEGEGQGEQGQPLDLTRSRSSSPSSSAGGGGGCDGSSNASGAAPRRGKARSHSVVDTSIAAEEWSDEDLEFLGDNRGEDAKLKRFFARDNVFEIDAIVDVRPAGAGEAGEAGRAGEQGVATPSPSESAEGHSAAPATATADGEASAAAAAVVVPQSFEFLIRWKDRTKSWEPERNLKGCQSKLAAFVATARASQWMTAEAAQQAARQASIRLDQAEKRKDAPMAMHSKKRKI